MRNQASIRAWWRWTALIVAIGLTACFPLRSPNCGRIPPDDGCVRVLFIGNSYTFSNNLPGTFATVSHSLGHEVYTDMIAPGGATLSDHAASAEVMAKIRSGHWTYVVLQEQSLVPADAELREKEMYPAARLLAGEIVRAGARPVFYAAWGREHGWPEKGFADYVTLQAGVTQGYRAIADELHVTLVPVGDAWAAVTADHKDIPLWQSDGSHPTAQGTFLAANVFAATLFRQVPRGLGSRGAVPEIHVYRLQQAAAKAAGLAPGSTQ